MKGGVATSLAAWPLWPLRLRTFAGFGFCAGLTAFATLTIFATSAASDGSRHDPSKSAAAFEVAGAVTLEIPLGEMAEPLRKSDQALHIVIGSLEGENNSRRGHHYRQERVGG